MSIRYIAVELYRLEREVSEMEKKINQASSAQRDSLELELKKLIAERDRYRGMLESKKEPPFSRKFD